MSTTTLSHGYRVTCSDGEVRHSDLFPSRSEASKWAEWGHCCLADHSIEDVHAARRRRLEEVTGLGTVESSTDEVHLGMRFVLVEVSKYDGSLYLTSHATPEDAAAYHDGQEEPSDWPVHELVDLDTGERHQADTVARYSTTFVPDHGPGCDGPYNCVCSA